MADGKGGAGHGRKKKTKSYFRDIKDVHAADYGAGDYFDRV